MQRLRALRIERDAKNQSVGKSESALDDLRIIPEQQPSDTFKLWTAHAKKQLERLTKQPRS